MSDNKKKYEPTVILDSTWNGGQSWNRQRIEVFNNKRFRYTVKVDAYKFQSSATAEIWKEEAWSQVHYIPGENIKTVASYVDKGVTESAFAADINELRRVALAVSGVKVPRRMM